MDVCIENVFPAVAMPFNPFQREPRQDKRHDDKSHKIDPLDSGTIPDFANANIDALIASVKAGTNEPELLGERLEYLSERLGMALCASGQRTRTIGVQIRYMDQFSARGTIRLTRPTNDERELLAEAKELFASLFKRRVPIQMLGLSATNFEACSQANELPGYELVPTGARHTAPLRVAARMGLR
jgi:nucleotidyltransferase/DNA polymerase involved in DNA repair